MGSERDEGYVTGKGGTEKKAVQYLQLLEANSSTNKNELSGLCGLYARMRKSYGLPLLRLASVIEEKGLCRNSDLWHNPAHALHTGP